MDCEQLTMESIVIVSTSVLCILYTLYIICARIETYLKSLIFELLFAIFKLHIDRWTIKFEYIVYN